MARRYIEDPEPPEETPEFKEEMFRTYVEMGWKPEDLMDKKEASEFADWLKKQ